MTQQTLRTKTAIILSAILLASCASAPPPYPDSLHWFRDSAERQAAYRETYLEAAESARRLSPGLPPQSWGVILDIDETILDNSTYQRRLALAGQSYQKSAWDAWVQEAAAPALPGAKEFIDTVLDALHGQVILITNRAQAQCSVTEENLKRVLIRYTRILCDRAGDADKNSRFQDVTHGSEDQTTHVSIAPVNVLIFVGDNIQDFPNLSQSTPGDPALFGVRYFVLPNPMYGSWTKLPTR